MNKRALRRTLCEECGAVMTDADEIFSWSDGKSERLVCGDCFDALVGSLSRIELAALIGSTVYCGEWEDVTGSSG